MFKNQAKVFTSCNLKALTFNFLGFIPNFYFAIHQCVNGKSDFQKPKGKSAQLLFIPNIVDPITTVFLLPKGKNGVKIYFFSNGNSGPTFVETTLDLRKIRYLPDSDYLEPAVSPITPRNAFFKEFKLCNYTEDVGNEKTGTSFWFVLGVVICLFIIVAGCIFLTWLLLRKRKSSKTDSLTMNSNEETEQTFTSAEETLSSGTSIVTVDSETGQIPKKK